MTHKLPPLNYRLLELDLEQLYEFNCTHSTIYTQIPAFRTSRL
ncbi:hypothetical protein SBF1_5340006 [Candidatus Desulfosporosinus infrequens]|uniref:Uncharacterized protein n=1 Tax=Candidatus Desulfosporosinus infrequens TaxID=2043169 RepID=A0A2U3LIS3_9FIRM|nr:hypothetical protein SBF1_5340006 [Candidatus Desulfosporosinus infrequens]